MTPYVRFVSAAGFTNLADGIATLAWMWLATLLTRDPLLAVIVPVMLRLPWFLFAIPAGLITDRNDRRTLILRMDVLRASAFLLAAVSVWLALPLPPAAETGVADWPLFIAINAAALLVGFAEVVRDNAAQTMLPALVPHDTLERANSRMWTVEQITNQLIGPVAGAFLIGLFLPAPFLVNAACFAFAALMVASLDGSFRPAARPPSNLRAELGEAWRFLITSPLLRTFAITTGFWNMFHQMTLAALVFHAQENLQLSASAYGVLLTAAAFGGIVGGLIAESAIKRLGAVWSAQWMLALSLVDFAVMALVPSIAGVAFALFIGGMSGIVWDTVSVSNRQRLIPDEMLGRVNSMYRLLAWGMMPIGLLLGGTLIRLADGPLERGWAIMTPFAAAAIGLAILLAFQWKAIARGLAAIGVDR